MDIVLSALQFRALYDSCVGCTVRTMAHEHTRRPPLYPPPPHLLKGKGTGPKVAPMGLTQIRPPNIVNVPVPPKVASQQVVAPPPKVASGPNVVAPPPWMKRPRVIPPRNFDVPSTSTAPMLMTPPPAPKRQKVSLHPEALASSSEDDEIPDCEVEYALKQLVESTKDAQKCEDTCEDVRPRGVPFPATVDPYM